MDQEVDEEYNLTTIQSDRGEQVQKRVYLLPGNSKFKLRWDIMIIILAFYNCTITPFLMSFSPELQGLPFFIVFDCIIDVIFVMDLFLSFFTTYVDKLGFEVKKQRRIIAHNLRTSFPLRLVSSVPIEILSLFESRAESFTIIFVVFKILRFSRLGRIFLMLRTRASVKFSAKVGESILLLLLYLNIMACAWFYVVKINKTWRPPAFTALPDCDIYDSSLYLQYSILFYSAIYTVVGIEMFPTTKIEYIFMGITLMMGALVTSMLVGEMLNRMNMVNKDTKTYNKIQDQFVNYMNKFKIDNGVQSKVLSYIVNSYKREVDEKGYEIMMERIPPSYRKEVLLNMYCKIFSKNKLFLGNQRVIKFLCLAFRQTFCKPESIVIHQNESPDMLYFVAHGKFEVHIGSFVRILKSGEYFGEVSLLYNTNRTATVVCRQFSSLAYMTSRAFAFILREVPSLHKSMCNKIVWYNDDDSKFIKKCIRNIEYFKNLTGSIINTIRFNFHKNSYPQNYYLFLAGAKCQKAFIIVSGYVQLTFVIDEEDFPIENLGPGTILNTKQVLMEHEYYVSCRAMEDVTVYEFSYDDIEKICQSNVLLKHRIDRYTHRHMFYDMFSQTNTPVLIPLDYINKKLKLRMIFKSQVIKKIIIRRHFRKLSHISLPRLSKKVKAFLDTYHMGLEKTAYNISCGIIRPQIVEALHLIMKHDEDNPQLPQFFIQLARIENSYDYLQKVLEFLRIKSKQNQIYIDDLRESVKVFSTFLRNFE